MAQTAGVKVEVVGHRSLAVVLEPSMAQQSFKDRLAAVKDRSSLRLTTLGRKTGKRHTVTVWFLVDGDTVYLINLRLQRDWPRNVIKDGHAELDVGGQHFTGHAK